MWVALKRAVNSKVALGGSDRSRLVTASARSDVPLFWRLTQARSRSQLVSDFVDDSLWNAWPSLNEARCLRSAVSRIAVL